MDYLITHHTHPNVDEVHRQLVKRIPTLSKTTVYNTLRLLSDHKAAQMLTIDDHRVCYDGDTRAHSHFLCRQCGRIIDMPCPTAAMAAEDTPFTQGVIDEVQIYYKACAGNASQKGKRQKGEKAKEEATHEKGGKVKDYAQPFVHGGHTVQARLSRPRCHANGNDPYLRHRHGASAEHYVSCNK